VSGAKFQLGVGDARAALALAAEVADCADARDFAAQVDALCALIGAEAALVTTCREWTVDPAIEAGDPRVYTAELMGVVARNWREHPVMSLDLASRGAGARRISDHLAAREWRRRTLFNDFFRPLGMTWELSAQLVAGPPGSSCCVSLHRGARDFSPRDVSLLEALAPHLRAARARIASRPGDEAPPRAAALALRLPITAREAEVLARLAAGRTNDGIAADLRISPHTVARHVEHVYAKLGVHTRVAAARAALAALGDQ
jgi:DNA-binding CsgD family transcriptional regulator